MAHLLLVFFFCDPDRVLLRADLFSLDRDRDLEGDRLELQELLCERLFLRSGWCLECLARAGEELRVLPRWCLSLALQGAVGWD